MAVGTIRNMGGSKSLPDGMSEHVVREFNALIDLKFVDADGSRWSQTEIGKAMAVEDFQPRIETAYQRFIHRS